MFSKLTIHKLADREESAPYNAKTPSRGEVDFSLFPSLGLMSSEFLESHLAGRRRLAPTSTAGRIFMIYSIKSYTKLFIIVNSNS